MVGCHRSTIQREVTANGGRTGYSAHTAHARARHRRSRSRSRYRFDTDPGLADEVRRLLCAGYSPYAIAHITNNVCAETIYQGIYSGRLNVNPDQVLRTRRRQRRHVEELQRVRPRAHLGPVDRPRGGAGGASR